MLRDFEVLWYSARALQPSNAADHAILNRLRAAVVAIIPGRVPCLFGIVIHLSGSPDLKGDFSCRHNT